MILATEAIGNVAEEHMKDLYGVRFFTRLTFRECVKKRCRWFARCAPLHWTKTTTTEWRECVPAPNERHFTHDYKTFGSDAIAEGAKQRCVEEHINELWPD